MKKQIIFRSDGNSEIGFGHIYRCLALAEMLKSSYHISFFSTGLPQNIVSIFEEKNIAHHSIESNQEFVKFLSGDEFVVIDNYYFDHDFQVQIKETGALLVCIDDLQERKFAADLIINQAPGIDAWRYSAPVHTQYAVGLDFALLRPEFLAAASQEKNKSSSCNLLICFGGSDPKNLTYDTLMTVLDLGIFETIDVVTGPGYKHKGQVNALVGKFDHVAHHNNLNATDLIKIMHKNTYAIVPTSGIFLEALALGLTIISGYYVDNQRHLFTLFKKGSYLLNAFDFSEKHLKEALLKLDDFEMPLEHPIDGKSAMRYLKLFKSLELECNYDLRLATVEDLEITYKWATDKGVRKYSFDKRPIPFEGHKNWFTKKIKDPLCYYYILYNIEGKAMGSIRFDCIEEEAMISMLIDTDHHNKGLGTILLKFGMKELKRSKNSKLRYIVGEIMYENIASQRSLEKLGFKQNLGKEGVYKYVKEL